MEKLGMIRIPVRLKLYFRKCRIRLFKKTDLLLARHVDIEHIKTVCLILGPYRNLSTLTAAIIALHPNCQVFNHGGIRIFNDRLLDFLRYGRDGPIVYSNFLKYAIHVSKSGYPGYLGGSILKSHVFRHGTIRDLFCRRYGDARLKKQIRVLLWKESMALEHHIRNHGIDLCDILDQYEAVKFVLPVRNPLDCAISNQKIGYASRPFMGLGNNPEFIRILETILDQYLSFCKLQELYQERFLAVFEFPFNRDVMQQISQFLDLPPDDDWISDGLTAWQIHPGYAYPDELLNRCELMIEEKFKDFAAFKDRLICCMKHGNGTTHRTKPLDSRKGGLPADY